MTPTAAAEPSGWSTDTSCGVFLQLTALAPLGASVSVLAVLRYERTDPFAVWLECHVAGRLPVVWRFARETLEAGVRGRAGVGCVMVCNTLEGGRAKCADIYIVLNNAENHGVLRGPAEPFTSFLTRSRRLVPYGDESKYCDLETVLAELTAGSDNRGPDGLADVR